MPTVPPEHREQLMESMQAVDLLAQHLTGLSTFARRMRLSVATDVSAPVEIELSEITLGTLADRLSNEYQLVVVFEPSPYAEARWLHGTAAAIETFASTHRTAMAEDIDNSPIFLGKSAWEINYVGERYPDLAFLRTRERG